ncbi:MAG TPA: Smr/MutS family protein [Nevskiaceae bacterium]|nr:Smr/MutS family protein [Nevskiaceae bacterium]
MAPDEDDDAALFREAMKGVQRKGEARRAGAPRRAVSARPLQRKADERAVLQEMLLDPDPESMESGDTLSYRLSGVQDAVMRKLRRGQYALQAEVDLHGMNRRQAQHALAGFLALCQDRGYRCVRVIHGKGLGSPNSGPVIKRLVDSWLRRRSDVLAFCSARPADGGTGALYVLLRSA